MNLASKQLFAAGSGCFHVDTNSQIDVVKKSGNRDLLIRAQADKSLAKTTRKAIGIRIRKLA